MADPASRAAPSRDADDEVAGPAGRGWRTHAATLELGSPAMIALATVAAFTVARLAMAWFVGLGVDESYSVSAASEWHLSYFDHPPMHYWIVHLFAPVFGHGRGARLPFVALFAGSSWLMYRLTRRLFDSRAAAFAVFSLNVAAFFTIAAGGWVLPDGPLDFFLLAAAVVLADLFMEAEPTQSQLWRGWLLAGLFIGLAALSKYQAALFGVGVVAFLLSSPAHKRQLADPAPFVGGLICLAVLSPILIWNAGHGWASIGFQAGRGAPGHGVHPFGWLESLAGQMALLLPWIFIPMAIAGWRAMRAGPARTAGWFCVMLALPAIAVFTVLPVLGPKGLPHWPMPGWLMLFPVLGAYLAGGPAFQGWRRIWAIGALAFAVLVGTAATVEASTGWLGVAMPKTFKKGDPTIESLDWTAARAALIRRGLLMHGGPVIVALKWNEAGKIDNAVGDVDPVTVFSDDPREYRFRHNPAEYVGRDALIIGKAATVKARLAGVSPYFQSITPLAPIYVGRGGRPEIELDVVLAHDLLRPYPQTPATSRPAR
jgi:4-amino-4-deoxy-L-arabinose transferase-like glycosyltransferase